MTFIDLINYWNSNWSNRWFEWG